MTYSDGHTTGLRLQQTPRCLPCLGLPSLNLGGFANFWGRQLSLALPLKCYPHVQLLLFAVTPRVCGITP